MVVKTINATYTETYDLNTAIGELSMLAIHTPQAGALRRMFHGFFEQYKKYKINGCNIRMVCATQQALTPDLVGLEAGMVDPRDVLNPILFKACTGDNINLLLNQIYNQGESLNTSLGSNSVDQHVDSRAVAQRIYYQMLSDDTWRKEHPQRGLMVSGLRPMVHKVVTTQPFKWTGVRNTANTGTSGMTVNSRPAASGAVQDASTDQISQIGIWGMGGPSGSNIDSTYGDGTNATVFVSDGITEMPWLDTAVVRNVVKYDMEEETPVGSVTKAMTMINDVPRVYMGAIVLPPAILQRLYFRMQVSWSISFRDWRPSQEFGTLNVYDLVQDGFDNALDSHSISNSTYWNMYHSASAKAQGEAGNFGKEESSFTTTDGTEVEQIMEAGY